MAVLLEVDICVDSSVDSKCLGCIAVFLHYSLVVSTFEVDESAIFDYVTVAVEPEMIVALVVAALVVFDSLVVLLDDSEQDVFVVSVVPRVVAASGVYESVFDCMAAEFELVDALS